MLADFYNIGILQRLRPVTVEAEHLMKAGVEYSLDVSGNKRHLDGGAERLVVEWKMRGLRNLKEVERRITQGIGQTWQEEWCQPGPATTEQPAPKSSKQALLRRHLSPNESDGPGDTQKWNLFEEYLVPLVNPDHSYNRNSLSTMLRRWKEHVVCRPFH